VHLSRPTVDVRQEVLYVLLVATQVLLSLLEEEALSKALQLFFPGWGWVVGCAHAVAGGEGRL